MPSSWIPPEPPPTRRAGPLIPAPPGSSPAHNLTSDRHVAREWRPEWFTERDLILALDVDHYGWLRQSAPDQESMAKVRMLRSFDPAVAGKDPLDQGIEDPWYGGPRDFEACWDQIHAALPGIVEYVRSAIADQEARLTGCRTASRYALFHDPRTCDHRH